MSWALGAALLVDSSVVAGGWFPPVRTMTALKTGGLQVDMTVTDPQSGQVLADRWQGDGSGEVADVQAADGVAAWSRTMSGHFNVFDPGDHAFHPGQRLISGSVGEFPTVLRTSGGMVGWRHRATAYAAVYDPRVREWIQGEQLNDTLGGRLEDHPEAYEIEVGDGVVAWAWGLSVFALTYDPSIRAWRRGSVLRDGSGLAPEIRIENGTVMWAGHQLGYDPDADAWYDGPTKAMAFFVPSHERGLAPHRVWFWDGSIGGDSWAWDFGDGTTSTDRSPTHVYEQNGRFVVTLTVTGATRTSTHTHPIVVGGTDEGWVQVRLAPEEVVAAGAGWRLDGGPWRASAETGGPLAVGEHALEFRTIAGWRAPPSESVLVTTFVTQVLDRVYVSLPPPVVHTADYREPRWVLDDAEVNRVLAYWRAGAYHAEPAGWDGFAPGAGLLGARRHAADFQEPFGRLDDAEMERVLSYWRAGGYRADVSSPDGYSAGAALSGDPPPGVVTRKTQSLQP